MSQLHWIPSRLISHQRVFKVVFLGNSDVGKSSFIHHYCKGQFYSDISATVGKKFTIINQYVLTTISMLQYNV
uniref:Uncharacterized protein n=1 Tax=Salarias fasciatus TaxID=181472 RepID=A0A672GCL6_SALFA